MKTVKLKLRTHIDNGLMYLVYRNQGKGPITHGVICRDGIYNLPLMKNIRYRFLRNYKSYKVETWYTHGQWSDYYVYQNQGQGHVTLGVTYLDRFYNLPLMKNFHHTFLKNYQGYKNETWYTHGQWIDALCVPTSAPRDHNFWS